MFGSGGILENGNETFKVPLALAVTKFFTKSYIKEFFEGFLFLSNLENSRTIPPRILRRGTDWALRRTKAWIPGSSPGMTRFVVMARERVVCGDRHPPGDVPGDVKSRRSSFPPGDVPGLRRDVKSRRSGNIVPRFFLLCG